MIQTIVALSSAQIPSRNDYANRRLSRYALRASCQARDAVSSLNTAVNSKETSGLPEASVDPPRHSRLFWTGIWGVGVVLERVRDDSDGMHDEKLHPSSNHVNIVTNHYKRATLLVFSKHYGHKLIL